MAKGPSASSKQVKTRGHTQAESGTRPKHHQHRASRSKHEVTHILRACHSKRTISVEQAGQKDDVTHLLRAGHGQRTISVEQASQKTRSRTN